ncbi:MAG: hypothetical protein NT027_11100 [Proteobacteria bacterium]|nr:hypothetical protein [Pseudomonadota bacterium]
MAKIYLFVSFIASMIVSLSANAEINLSVGDVITHKGERITCGTENTNPVPQPGMYVHSFWTSSKFRLTAQTITGNFASITVWMGAESYTFVCDSSTCSADIRGNTRYIYIRSGKQI